MGRKYRLKTHRKGPYDLEKFCEEIRQYTRAHPDDWNVHRLQTREEAREIYNALRRISLANWGNQNEFPRVAKRLGFPFIPRKKIETAEVRKKKTLERIAKELREFHTDDEGNLRFLTPNEIKEKYPGLYQRCVQQGGYAQVLDQIFGPGSYEKSTPRPQIHLLDKKLTLESAVEEVTEICRERDSYIHVMQLRDERPDLFNRALRALRMNSKKSRKKISYVDFFNKFCLEELTGNKEELLAKFKPPEIVDNARMGYTGELFTYAALYIEHPNAILFPGFPRQFSDDPHLRRFRIDAPNNINKKTGEKARDTCPDVALRAGRYTFAIETKSGLYFLKSNEMTTKYHETKTERMTPMDEDDNTTIIWGGVHLHFAPERMNMKALEDLENYRRKNNRPSKIFPATYFEGLFSQEPLLGSLYSAFLTNPLAFVRDESNIKLAEEIVLGLSPDSVQMAVKEQRERDIARKS